MRRAVIALAAIAAASTAYSQWQWISPARCAHDADLIVVGTLEHPTKDVVGNHEYEQAHLRVEQVLFGRARGGETLTLTWDNPRNLIGPRVDHKMWTGKRKLWMLKRSADATVRADTPNHVLDLVEERNIRWTIDHFLGLGDRLHDPKADLVRALLEKQLAH